MHSGLYLLLHCFYNEDRGFDCRIVQIVVIIMQMFLPAWLKQYNFALNECLSYSLDQTHTQTFKY